jgi:hypothetical protein
MRRVFLWFIKSVLLVTGVAAFTSIFWALSQGQNWYGGLFGAAIPWSTLAIVLKLEDIEEKLEQQRQLSLGEARRQRETRRDQPAA